MTDLDHHKLSLFLFQLIFTKKLWLVSTCLLLSPRHFLAFTCNQANFRTILQLLIIHDRGVTRVESPLLGTWVQQTSSDDVVRKITKRDTTAAEKKSNFSSEFVLVSHTPCSSLGLRSHSKQNYRGRCEHLPLSKCSHSVAVLGGSSESWIFRERSLLQQLFALLLQKTLQMISSLASCLVLLPKLCHHFFLLHNCLLHSENIHGTRLKRIKASGRETVHLHILAIWRRWFQNCCLKIGSWFVRVYFWLIPNSTSIKNSTLHTPLTTHTHDHTFTSTNKKYLRFTVTPNPQIHALLHTNTNTHTHEHTHVWNRLIERKEMQ